MRDSPLALATRGRWLHRLTAAPALVQAAARSRAGVRPIRASALKPGHCAKPAEAAWNMELVSNLPKPDGLLRSQAPAAR